MNYTTIINLKINGWKPKNFFLKSDMIGTIFGRTGSKPDYLREKKTFGGLFNPKGLMGKKAFIIRYRRNFGDLGEIQNPGPHYGENPKAATRDFPGYILLVKIWRLGSH